MRTFAGPRVCHARAALRPGGATCASGEVIGSLEVLER
jgi:hypothetical protein